MTQYRENRIAYVNTTRRVALDPLLFQGVPVTALSDPSDYIQFTVYNADGTVLQETQNALYEQIYTTAKGQAVYAWSGMVDVGENAQQLTVKWEISLFAAKETLFDYIDVLDDLLV